MLGALAVALFGACNLDASGVPPPPGKIAYPTALALSREPVPRTLFVANSNFDLTYSAGSVQGYDLTQLERVFEVCRNLEEENGMNGGPTPGSVVPNFTMPPAAPTMDAGLDGGAPLDGSFGDADMQDPDAAGAPDAAAEPFDAGPIELPGLGVIPAFRDAQRALCDERDQSNPSVSKYVRNCCLRLGKPPGDMTDVTLKTALNENELLIDSYATGLAVSPDNRRLYVPISSRSRLVYADLDANQRLSCGDEASAGDRRRCRRGPGRGRDDDEPEANFPGQPSAIAVGRLADLGVTAQAFANVPGRSPDSTVVLTAHEAGGLSMFVESNTAPGGGLDPESVPVLETVHRNALREPTSVVLDPAHQLAYVTISGAERRVFRFGARVVPNAYCDPALPNACEANARREDGPRELLYQTTAIQLSGVAIGDDLRDIAIDPKDSSRLFVLTRGSPLSVLFLTIDPRSPLEARVVDAVRVGVGPSKLRYVALGDRSFLLVSAYDARSIFVIDVRTRELVTQVRNLSGPFDMVVDEARRLLYVADFRTSVVRVVDLAGLVDRRKRAPSIIATLGGLEFTGSLR